MLEKEVIAKTEIKKLKCLLYRNDMFTVLLEDHVFTIRKRRSSEMITYLVLVDIIRLKTLLDRILKDKVIEE